MSLKEIKNLEGVKTLKTKELIEIKGGFPSCGSWNTGCGRGICASCCILHQIFCEV